ncbi:pleckstrin homology-like domain family B member 3 isoform X3 [Alligator mississippiensis]|uniref:pleckstrin homology-like domain family B member 3 isoform X3 n=1 Tax=Alligator mississippiensis TaxID=8496 RepID=UPI0028779F3A|nr:pleckstrin homology-like domain family B member 3 isoform X3 [Alligator mississippiensis]
MPRGCPEPGCVPRGGGGRTPGLSPRPGRGPAPPGSVGICRDLPGRPRGKGETEAGIAGAWASVRAPRRARSLPLPLPLPRWRGPAPAARSGCSTRDTPERRLGAMKLQDPKPSPRCTQELVPHKGRATAMAPLLRPQPEGESLSSDEASSTDGPQAKSSELDLRISDLQHQAQGMSLEEGCLRPDQDHLRHLRHVLAETEQRSWAQHLEDQARLQAEHQGVEELRQRLQEAQTRLEQEPESLRERGESQVREASELLETALKRFEDLEFQQLERESRREEEREAASAALACEIARLQRTRTMQQQEQKEKPEGRRMEKTQLLPPGDSPRIGTGDPSSDTTQELTKLMFTQRTDRRLIVLGAGPLFTVRSSVQGSIGLQRSGSLPRRRGDRPSPRVAQRPLSLHGNVLNPGVRVLQSEGGANDGGGRRTDLAPYSSLESCVAQLAEMERRVQEAMAERERLLQAREAKKAAQQASKPPELPPPAKGVAPLDLRRHLEALGHSVETCGDVRVSSRACKGFLVKMGGRVKTWRRRWFCFDRHKRLLAYYADKEETKLKGVIYFQAIEEVYYDHLRSAWKSPNPALTFCVKTYDRLFCLVAPSAEAMRIWIDAIVTAAEENARY